MPNALFQISKADLKRIRTADDATFDQIVKSLSQVDGAPSADADPIADIMKALDSAIETVNKSNVADKQAAIREAIQKAYDDLSDHAETTAEIALMAGESQGFLKARGKKMPENDDNNGGDAPDCEDDEDMEKFLKSAPSAVRKFFTDMQAVNKALTDKVDALTEKDEIAKYRQMAIDAGEAPEYGETLRKMGPEVAATVAKTLGDKNKVINKSKLFGEIGGGSSSDAGSPLEALNGHAHEIVKSSNGKVTLAKAFTQACHDHPDLYAEYQRSR